MLGFRFARRSGAAGSAIKKATRPLKALQVGGEDQIGWWNVGPWNAAGGSVSAVSAERPMPVISILGPDRASTTVSARWRGCIAGHLPQATDFL